MISPERAGELLREAFKTMTPEEFQESWKKAQPQPGQRMGGYTFPPYIYAGELGEVEDVTPEAARDFLLEKLGLSPTIEEVGEILRLLEKSGRTNIYHLQDLVFYERDSLVMEIFRERRAGNVGAYEVVAALLDARPEIASYSAFSERVNRFIDILEGWESLHASNALAASA